MVDERDGEREGKNPPDRRRRGRRGTYKKHDAIKMSGPLKNNGVWHCQPDTTVTHGQLHYIVFLSSAAITTHTSGDTRNPEMDLKHYNAKAFSRVPRRPTRPAVSVSQEELRVVSPEADIGRARISTNHISVTNQPPIPIPRSQVPFGLNLFIRFYSGRKNFLFITSSTCTSILK